MIFLIDRCEYCNGEAYVFTGEHPTCLPCPLCKGAGEMSEQDWPGIQVG